MEPAYEEEHTFIRLVTPLYRRFVACNKDCGAENWSSICRPSRAQRSAHSSPWQAPLRFIINNNTRGSMALSTVRVPKQFTSWIIHRGLHSCIRPLPGTMKNLLHRPIFLASFLAVGCEAAHSCPAVLGPCWSRCRGHSSSVWGWRDCSEV